MSACSVLRSIENVSQAVAEFLGDPGSFTPDEAANLIVLIESIRGAVRELPLAAGPKNDLLRRLNEAQFLLQQTDSLTVVETLLAVLQVLQVSALKVQNRKLCCPQGQVTVTPSCTFSTACNPCRCC